MELSELIEAAGTIQAQQGPSATIELYESWLAQQAEHPTSHVARFNLAVLLSDQGRPQEAEAHLRLAIERFPNFLQAYFNLGLAVERQGRKDEALTHWLKLASMADLTQDDQKELAISALNQIGRLQEVLKNYPQAEAALKQSLLLNPKQPDALQHWIHLRQKQCKWPVYEEFGEVREYDMLMATSPLAMLALTDDPVKQLLAATTFNQRKFNFPEAKRPKPWTGHDKIRLGYVSGDLCTHAVGLLLPDFLEQHDKTRFELYAYDFSPEDGSETRRRIRAAFDHFIDIRNLTDEDVVQKVRADEIDVLIDMHGLSSGARPKIFAMRPAYLQLTWLGYIGTTAFPWIDYVVADNFLLSSKQLPDFSERLLNLPHCFLPSSVSTLAHRPDRPVPSDPARRFVFACFNNIYKIKPDLLNAWCSVLNNTEIDSELWLLDDNPEATRQVHAYLVPRLADIGRVKFVPRTSYKDYQDRLRQVDLYLDSYPYNGGSTIRDVVSQGVPFVTFSGNTMVSRMGGSLLSEIGLQELIVNDYRSYVDRCLMFVKDGQLRAMCQTRIKAYLSQAQDFNRLKVSVLEQKITRLLLGRA